MLNIEIKNICGIREAAFDIADDGLTKIVGRNAAGKSSVVHALAALFSRDPNPAGLSKTAQYVNDGAKEGYATMMDGDGNYVKFDPSDDGVSKSGDMPTAHPAAVGIGMRDLLFGKPKERHEAWRDIARPNITKGVLVKDLAEHLLGEEIDDERAKRILSEESVGGEEKFIRSMVDTIIADGFDAAANYCAEQRASAKNDWKRAVATGDDYGSKKGASPPIDGLTSEIKSASLTELEKEVTEAEQHLLDLREEKFVTKADAEAGVEAKSQLQGLQDSYERDKKATADAERELQKLLEEINSLEGEKKRVITADEKATLADAKARLAEAEAEAEKAGDALTCPSCEAKLRLEDDTLVAVGKGVDVAALRREIERLSSLASEPDEELRKKIEAVSAKQDEKAKEISGLQNSLAATKARIDDCNAKIKAAEGKVGDVESAVRGEMQGEDAVKQAKERLEIGRRFHAAVRAHNDVVRYHKTHGRLDAKGIRADKTREAVDKLDAKLSSVCEQLGFKKVSVDAVNFVVRYNGRELAICSKSEQWRAQTAIQYLVASEAKRPFVLLDGADILDEPSLAKFLEGASKIDAGAVVAFTSMDKAGQGCVRIDDGGLGGV